MEIQPGLAVVDHAMTENPEPLVQTFPWSNGMSVTSQPIRRLVPMITAIIVIGAFVVGETAIWQIRDARGAQKTFNSYLAAKKYIERLALPDVQIKYNGVVIAAYPQTADLQNTGSEQIARSITGVAESSSATATSMGEARFNAAQ